MHLKQLLRCAIGRHARSGKHSRVIDGKRISECRGCGRKMILDDFVLQLTCAGSPTLLPEKPSEN